MIVAGFQLIIDGYNLLHAAGLAQKKYGQGELEQAREKLLSGLRRMLAVREQEQTVIVFDAGIRAPSLADDMLRSGQIRILFSTQHGNADALIETLIEDHPSPRKLTVVSSDHRIQRSARLHQALFLDSESFLADLMRRPKKVRRPLPPHPKQTGEMTAGELDYWMREFGGMNLGGEPTNVPERGASPAPAKGTDKKGLEKKPVGEGKGGKKETASVPQDSRRRTAPKYKAPGKGLRRPFEATGNEPAIFSPEWIAELQAWVTEQERKRR